MKTLLLLTVMTQFVLRKKPYLMIMSILETEEIG